MGGHTVSHPRCVLLKVTFSRLSSERGGEGQIAAYMS